MHAHQVEPQHSLQSSCRNMEYSPRLWPWEVLGLGCETVLFPSCAGDGVGTGSKIPWGSVCWKGSDAAQVDSPSHYCSNWPVSFSQVHRDAESQLVLQEWKRERKEMR